MRKLKKMKIVITYLLLIFGFWTSFSQTELKEILAEKLLIKVPVTDSIGFSKKNNKIKIDKYNWDNFGFNKIETYNSDFEYSFLGQAKFNYFMILIIERQYTEKNIHWTCIVNKDYEIIDYIQSAYNNAEGFLKIESEIDHDKIIVKQWNEFSEIKSKEFRYSITNKGFIK